MIVKGSKADQFRECHMSAIKRSAPKLGRRPGGREEGRNLREMQRAEMRKAAFNKVWRELARMVFWALLWLPGRWAIPSGG